jgi:hypothetical protein
MNILIIIFWVVTPCCFAGGYQCFRGTYGLHIHFNPEDGGDMLLRNTSNYLQYYTASKPRRRQSIYSLP